MKHIYISALLLSASALNLSAAWDGTAAQWTAGTGAETDPYLIQTEQHLAYLQKSVNEGETYEGKFFRLAADLDMSGKTMNPIGFYDDYYLQDKWYEDSKVFLGVFDGAFHTIDNANIEIADKTNNEIGGVGLFAIGRKSTIIRNLKLGIKVTVGSSESNRTGGILGHSDGATVENCSFAGTIKGGGIESGGIVGCAQNGAIINGCLNFGTVNGYTSTGGIVGSTENATVTNCLHMGDANGDSNAFMIGGIIGWADKTTLSSCVSLGIVLGQVGTSYNPGKGPVCGEFERSTATACYYVKALTGCDPVKTQKGIEELSETDMKSVETLKTLNGGNDEGAWVAVDGDYPTLAWTLKSTSGIAPVIAAEAADVKVCAGTIIIKAHNAAYTIADIAGRVVAAGSVEGEVSFTPAAGGVYIIAVRTADGATSVTKLQL